MKIDYVPIICIVFLTMFLLVVVPTTNTPKGDIGDIEMMISPATDSVTTVNVSVKTDTLTNTTTTIQH